MKHAHQNAAQKKTVTLEISEDLAIAAKRQNIDLSSALEAQLCQQLGEQGGPDFCEDYAKELSNNRKEAENLKQYGRDHGLY